MNFNNVFVILLHLVILIEIVSSYYQNSNSHKYRSRYGRNKYEGNRNSYNRNRKWTSSQSWKKHHGITRSKVVLASGKDFYVTNPRMKKHWKCGDKPNLITLNPTGAMGKKEYTMVKTELENQNVPGGVNPFTGHTIIKIQKIENPCVWNKYIHRRKEIEIEAKTANEHLFFHGSRSIPDIIVTGFDERYANIHGKFGAGLYFASHSAKSHSFTSPQPDGTRLILLCRVALGKVFITKQMNSHAHSPSGYHSVKGDIIMPEYIVYRGEQDYTLVTRYYNCQQYGHSAKYCRDRNSVVTVGALDTSDTIKECPKTFEPGKWKCATCFRFKIHQLIIKPETTCALQKRMPK